MGFIQDRFNEWRNKKQVEKEMKKHYWKEREISVYNNYPFFLKLFAMLYRCNTPI